MTCRRHCGAHAAQGKIPPFLAGSAMPLSPVRRKWMIAVALVAALLVLVLLVMRWRGPALPGYQIGAAPLVQNVVATGRGAELSRVPGGAESAGRWVAGGGLGGDRVQPGAVLVVLRAADLEARRDGAGAALEALRRSERPEARARVRQAGADLAQAEREAARRRELG